LLLTSVLLTFCLLSLLVRHRLLDGTDMVRPLLLEAFEVQLLDVLRQGNLPRLLPVIGHTAQLLGVHSEFSGHLDLGMGKVEPSAGICPGLESRR